MTATPDISDHTIADDVGGFAERLFNAVLGAQEVHAVHLGLVLGYYDALADGAKTSSELATATGAVERYTREWLEHQAVAGYVTVVEASADALLRRYGLTPAQTEVLTDQLSTAYVAPMARFVTAVGTRMDDLVEVYRNGGGVSWDALGHHAREAQAAMNRPMFVRQLAGLLADLPELHDRLRAGARIADLGCGYGWSSIGLALAYQDVTIDGYDVDAPSIAAATRNAIAAGVHGRVQFTLGDAAAMAATRSYDVVFAFECVHDVPDPVGFLRTAQALAGDDGLVVVMDERVAEEFVAPGDEVERLMYGFSVTCCLPDSMAHPVSAGTGTVMRTSTLSGYAAAAGFAATHVLPIEHDFFRFYRLDQARIPR